MQRWFASQVCGWRGRQDERCVVAVNDEVQQMKYVGRLILVVQAALIAGWVNAGTVTVDGNSCGSTTGPVSIDTNGNISISTNGNCAPGSVSSGPYALNVTVSGTGTKGTVSSNVTGTGVGISSCSASCSDTYASGTSVTLTATPPTGTDTFAWGGACSGSASTCTVTMSAAKTVSATYTAAGSTTACPTGAICIERSWPAMAQELYSMKANQVLAIKINTTAAGAIGWFQTMYTTGNTAKRQVSLSTTPGDFTGGGKTSCVTTGTLELTTSAWEQQGTSTSKCQLPANSTAWINIRFTNCTTASCSFFFKD
jgi:hypothetical protein